MFTVPSAMTSSGASAGCSRRGRSAPPLPALPHSQRLWRTQTSERNSNLFEGFNAFHVARCATATEQHARRCCISACAVLIALEPCQLGEVQQQLSRLEVDFNLFKQRLR